MVYLIQFPNKFLNTKKNVRFWWRFLQDPEKDNMGQTVMSQMQIFNKHLNTKKYRSLFGNFYKILKRTIWVKPYCPWYNVLRKLLNTTKYLSFRMKLLLDPGKDDIWDTWKDNRGQTVLLLGQNFLELLKKNQQQTTSVSYKSWSIFSNMTVWVNLYCP